MFDQESLKKFIPPNVRARVVAPLMRRIGAALIDSGAYLMGEKDDSIPPTRLHFVGHGSFTAIGYEFLRYFTEFAGLKPNEDVLDVGCGIGRMAIPLANFLRQGQYRGIDIVPAGIEWCQQNITPKHPNFRFELSDIKNTAYNPDGRYKASEYRFPFDDQSFDFVFLTSVFTHLVPEDAENYLSEISRVLRPGGRLLGTWFLLNSESRQLVAAGRGSRPIVYEFKGKEVMVENPAVPEAAIAFDEELIRGIHAKYQLRLQDDIRFGKWCGREDFVSYQDIIVAHKAP